MKKPLLLILCLTPFVLIAQQEGRRSLITSSDEQLVITGSAGGTWSTVDEGNQLTFKGASNPLRFDLKKQRTVVTARRASGVLLKQQKKLTFDHGQLEGSVVATQTGDDGSTRVIRTETAQFKMVGKDWIINSASAATVTITDKGNATVSANRVEATIGEKDTASYSLIGSVRLNSTRAQGAASLATTAARAAQSGESMSIELPSRALMTFKDAKTGNVLTLAGNHGESTLYIGKLDKFPLQTASFKGSIKFTFDGIDKEGNATKLVGTADLLTYDEATRTIHLTGNVFLDGDNSVTFGTTTADDATIVLNSEHKPKTLELTAKEGRSTLKEHKEEKP